MILKKLSEMEVKTIDGIEYIKAAPIKELLKPNSYQELHDSLSKAEKSELVKEIVSLYKANNVEVLHSLSRENRAKYLTQALTIAHIDLHPHIISNVIDLYDKLLIKGGSLSLKDIAILESTFV